MPGWREVDLMRIIAIVIIMMLCMPLAADYSSLTEQERTDLFKALGMSIEYKIILEGKETHRIEEIVKVDDGQYRVRLLLIVDKPDGGVREIRRDLYVKISISESSHWPWYIVSGAAGLVLGVLVAR